MDLLFFLFVSAIVIVHDELSNGTLRKTLKDMEE